MGLLISVQFESRGSHVPYTTSLAVLPLAASFLLICNHSPKIDAVVVLQGLAETSERADAVIQALATFVDTLLLMADTRASITIPSPAGFQPDSDPFHQGDIQVRGISSHADLGGYIVNKWKIGCKLGTTRSMSAIFTEISP